MLLRVKNLGPVREAELDLGKPLIVLTGPNNSGKTYLAWAAYSLSRLKGDTIDVPPGIADLIGRLPDLPEQSLDIGDLMAFKHDVLRATEEALRRRLPSDFAAPRVRFDTTRFEIVLTKGDEDIPTAVSYVYPYKRKHAGTSFRGFHIDGRSLSFVMGQRDERQVIEGGLISVLLSLLLDGAYVAFPVERLAINLFARELASARAELIDDLLTAGDEPVPSSSEELRDELRRRVGRYPLVVRDALQRAIRSTRNLETGHFADLADELEARVLGGSVERDDDDDLRFLPRQESNTKSLGLHESGSVVKSLVSLVLHLRYEAKPGQRLVIDEPELNLHPDNQRRVARILAKAVNRGLKIMMSTHSDYVIRELNNLVMLGQDSDEARKLVRDLGYQPDQTLRPDQIGAYLVNDGACTRLEVTETGFETKTIEDEIHKLNQDAQTIYLRLFCD